MMPLFFTKKINFWFFLLFFTIAIQAQSDYLPDIPDKETSLYDYADLLTPDQKIKLEQKLIAYADSTSTQIVVLTVSSLQGKNINLYATAVAHKWGIGQEGKDNGLLFLIAKNDRKMAIQVGYGLEYLLTDAMSRRIIETIVAPHFKEGNYYDGIDAGTTKMMQILSGEYVNDETTTETNSFPFFFVLLLFFIFFVLISKGGRSSGGTYYGGSGSGSFGGGSFGGGSSGGGFSGGFGGGGFGGGGASGGW